MKLSPVRPIIWVADIAASIHFYVKQLGFTCDKYSESWGWASLHRDDCEIMLTKPNEHIPFEKASFTGSFYINTSEVDLLWEELKDKATICYPIENFEYGMREFAVYDNNGYLLQFGQELLLPATSQ